jgi:hypothetical protein
VLRQLRRHAPQRPRPRHDHAPGTQLVQPLHICTMSPCQATLGAEGE